MNTVDVPHGNADVRCVEPALVGADGDDVAVLDGIPVEWGVAELATSIGYWPTCVDM